MHTLLSSFLHTTLNKLLREHFLRANREYAKHSNNVNYFFHVVLLHVCRFLVERLSYYFCLRFLFTISPPCNLYIYLRLGTHKCNLANIPDVIHDSQNYFKREETLLHSTRSMCSNELRSGIDST